MIAITDDTTKSSRLNRKRKKCCKVTDLFKSGLTDCHRAAILNMLLPHVTDGLAIPNKATTGHNYTWFFCTHQKLNSILLWCGVSSNPSKGWPRLGGIANLIHPTAQRFATMGGGLFPSTRNIRMNNNNPAQTGQSFKINNPKKMSLDDIIKQQNQQRGLEPLALEPELLLKRITDGGHSGQFLADAFMSAYRTQKPFTHSLGEITKLDTEAFRLFHEILHIRHIRGWNDDDLYDIEQQILAISGGAK